MASFNWRGLLARSGRRRGRGAQPPRWVRLAISAGVLALLILSVVLIARGCARKDPVSPPANDAVPASAPAVQPEGGDSAMPDEPEPDAPDPGEADPGAQEADEPEVNLDADLNAPPAPTASAGNRAITIRAIGDIVAHVPILKAAYVRESKTYDFSPMLELIADSMGAADYTVINVDGPMPGRKFINGYKGYPQFNTPPFLLDALRDAGVDMLTLANNHALDTYFDGLKATIDNVEKAGLDHIGTYRTQEEYDTPFVKEIGGIKVGFLNCATATNGMAKKSDPLASQFGLRMVSNSNAANDIAALRAAGAEAVVVFMHWGEEYLREVPSKLKKMAKNLVAAGADVVVGGHQHVVLPSEWLEVKGADGSQRRGLVLYSMGNFLSDQRARYRDSGIIFEFTLRDNPQTGRVE
ncbi:MAG: CapA family protein, partial [Christensenellaceae bacterium]|nr:CapA family protein [Christensenellaceae bacterium]